MSRRPVIDLLAAKDDGRSLAGFGLLLLVLLLSVVSCADGADPIAGPRGTGGASGADGTSPQARPISGSVPAVSSCSRAVEDLRAGVSPIQAGDVIEDATGDSTAYVLTVVPIDSSMPERVVLLECASGGWRTYASDEASVDLSGKDPTRYATHVLSWRSARESRLAPRASVVSDPSRTTTTSTFNAVPCTPAKNIEYEQCPAAVFVTTTTTTPPTTVAPTSTVPPSTAPQDPAPSTPPPATTPSAYCQAHPLDANCLVNPGFPG